VGVIQFGLRIDNERDLFFFADSLQPYIVGTGDLSIDKWASMERVEFSLHRSSSSKLKLFFVPSRKSRQA
jgi:hypothetical protein